GPPRAPLAMSPRAAAPPARHPLSLHDALPISPARAALWGVAVAFALSFLRRSTRLSLTGIVKTLEAAARTALPVIAACATAGIVAATVTGTGLGGRLGNAVIDIAQGNFLLVLLMTMIVSLILGMGLPTTANYVVTA